MKKTWLPLAVLAATALTPLYAHAWSREGHRLTALVAQDHLTPEAAAHVKTLLGRDSMADVASFADEYKQDHRETAGWHFTDIPGAYDTYDRKRDCPVPPNNPAATVYDCSLDRIPYFEAILKDPASTKDQKVFALKFLIHLMGDLHQPFHDIGDARGGNDIPVNMFGSTQCDAYPCELHATWDDGLIDHRGLSEKKYVALLEQEITANNWQQVAETGTLIDWANTAHHYAQNAWVTPNTFIGKDYYNRWIPFIDRQLALGGLRLADALNAIYATPTAPATTPAPAPAPTPAPAK